MTSPLSDVAIIGAGLAGTALALALHKESIPCRIYELRKPDAPELASGVVLTPNGLKVLDHLGVLNRISSRCWKSEYRTYKNDRDETTRKTLVANEELYGYKNHRLWRRWLLDEMKLMLQEQGVKIAYESKFDGIAHDGNAGVLFKINGQEERASMLVGADGIWSSVRKYLDAGIAPEYTGTVGAMAHIKRDTVKWPHPEYEKACTIQGKPGALFMIPEVEDGSEIMVGMQKQYPDRSRAEWDALSADKDELCNWYRTGYDEWHDTAKQIIDSVCESKESLYLWPFLRMPKLERWFSDGGRVIIVGDSAHAVPPSSGQGVNQALEDVFALTKLLRSGKDMLESLEKWQEMRQARIDAVFDWATNATNVQRLPEAERNRLIAEGKAKDPKLSETFDDMRWLYEPKIELEVEKWVGRRT